MSRCFWRRYRVRSAYAAVVAAAGLCLVSRAGLAASQDPREVPHKKILVTTTLNTAPDLTATLTEFFTGEKNEKTAINMLLGMYRAEEGRAKLIATRDYNAEVGGYVSRGSLQIIDLDRDGTNEVLVEYHHKELPGTTRVELEVIRPVADRLMLAWNGPVRVDTAAPSAGIPPAEREKFVREIDYPRTSSAEGRRICFRKTVSVAAGVVFDPPRILTEELDLSGLPALPAAPKAPVSGH